jgi:streptogramin lyase
MPAAVARRWRIAGYAHARKRRMIVRAVAALVLLSTLAAPAPVNGATQAGKPAGLHVVPLGGMWVYTGALDSDGAAWVAGSADVRHVMPDGRVVRHRLPYRGDTYLSTWADGAYWMVDEEIGGVIRMTPDGRFTRYPGIWGTDYWFDFPPTDIIEGPDGTVWLNDRQQRRIVSIAADGTVRTVVPLRGGDVGLDFLGVGGDGSVWFSDDRNWVNGGGFGDPHGGIARVLPDGRLEPFRFRKSVIYDGTIAPTGDLWFIRRTRRTDIVRIDPQGRLTSFRSPLPGAEEIAVGADGAIWVAGKSVARIGPDGHVVRMRHPSLASGSDLLLAGRDGRLWLSFGARNRFGWLPPNPCLSRRRLTLHLHPRRADPIRTVRVVVPGQLPRTVRGHNPTIPVDLRGYLPATVRVTLKVHSAHQAYTRLRTFRTCEPAP